LNVDFAVNYWLSNGMPKEKINFGMAFYGRSFKLVDPAKNYLGAPTTGTGISGPVSHYNLKTQV
jgi:chitinase